MFNSKKKKQFRKRRHSSDSDEGACNQDESVTNVLGDAKQIQKLRQRCHGISSDRLAANKEAPRAEKSSKDTKKLQTGGYIDMKTLKKEMSAEDNGELGQIGTSFAAETNHRDEDADMLKYVEEELAKRKGIQRTESVEDKSKLAEDALYQLPDHIEAITSKIKKTEDMLSNQMLSGIPEIDLGIESKIRNIEMTEEAKQKLVRERQTKDPGMLDFVPTNMAVNFMQHNRFNITEDKKAPVKREPQAPKPEPARVGDADRPFTGKPDLLNPTPGPTDSSKTALDPKQRRGEKSTDDFHFEKFKRHMRR